MMKLEKMTLLVAAVMLLAMGIVYTGQQAKASEAGVEPPEHEWSFSGVFGTYDRAQMQRGFEVFRQVCASCHSMKRVAFRNLATLGYSEGQIKAIAQDYSVEDGPNDEGDMFTRPARPSDHFPSPFANKAAAKYANNGAFPPDLSLIVHAREGGADYLAALLNGYGHAPEDVTLMSGQYWNQYMPGHIIAMPPPLSDGQVAYEQEGVPQTVEQYAKDVAAFLTWASDPHMEARKRTGTKAFMFLFVFGLILLNVKKKIWYTVK